MKTMQRLMQAIVMIVVACVGWLASAQIAAEETAYPDGTRWQAWVDVTGMSETKDAIVGAFDTIARNSGGRIVFMHATDAGGAIDLVAFGNESPSPGTAVAWYGRGMQGSWQSPEALHTASLNGLYAFSSSSTARQLLEWVQAHGGQAGQLQHRAGGLSWSWILADSGMAYTVIALLLLLVALAWTRACRRTRSDSIRIMCGVLPRQVRRQDTADDLAMALPPACFGMVVSVALNLCVHGMAYLGLFLVMELEGTALVLALFLAVSMLSSFMLRPRLSDLAARTVPYRLIRGGNALLCSATVLTCIVGMSIGATATMQYRKGMEDLAVWRSLASLASAQMSATATDQYVQVHDGNISSALAQLDEQDDLALSMSVSMFFVPSDGMPPTADQVRQAIAPFDDVVLCNRAFLRMLRVPSQSLEPVGIDALGPLLRDNIEAYDGLWQANAASPLHDHMYRWQSVDRFPSLAYGQDTGTLAGSASPLVIVVDDAARSLDLTGMLLPALSTGNMVFRSADALWHALESHGVADLVSSTSTIADAVYARMVRLRAEMTACTVAIVVIAVTLVMVGWFAAQAWAEEQERSIFVRHMSGDRFIAIIRRHAILVTLLVCVTTGLSLVLAFLMANGMVPLATVIVSGLFMVLAAAAEIAMAHRAARIRFRDTALRA